MESHDHDLLKQELEDKTFSDAHEALLNEIQPLLLEISDIKKAIMVVANRIGDEYDVYLEDTVKELITDCP